MTLTNSKEIVWWDSRINEKFVSIFELSKKHNIDVPEDLLVIAKKEWEIFLSELQINKIKEWKVTIIEIVNLELEQLRSDFQKRKEIWRQHEKIVQLEQTGKQEQLEWTQSFDLSKKLKAAAITWTTATKEKTKEIVNQTWEAVKKIKDAWIIAKFWDVFSDFFVNIKKEGFWWALGLFFKWFFWIFTWKEALKKAGKTVEEKLDTNSPEFKKTLSQTQNTVIDFFEKKTWWKLDEKTTNLLKRKLSPDTEWSCVSTKDFNKLLEIVKSWKKITFKDLENTKIIWNILSDPELEKIANNMLNKIRWELYNQLKESLWKSWIIINEWSSKENKLNEIIDKKVSKSTLKSFIDKGEWSFADVATIWIESLIFIPAIIWELWRGDVIDTSNLFIWFAKEWWDKLKIGLKWMTWNDIIPDLLWKITFGQLEDKIWNLDNEKRIVLLRAFYAELWLVWAVLWNISYYASSSLVTLAETGSQIKNSWIKWNIWKTISSLNKPPVAQLQSLLDKLSPWESDWLKNLNKSLELTKDSFQELDDLKNAPKHLRQKHLDNLDKISNKINKIKLASERWIKGEWLNNLKSFSKHPMKYHYFTTTLENIDDIAKSNSKLWASIVNWTFGKTLNQIRQINSSFNLRYIEWHTVLHISDKFKAKELFKALWKLSPEIIKSLFWRLPVILLSVNVYDEVINWDWNLLHSIMATNWFVWWWALLKESSVNIKNGDFSIKDWAVGGLWAFVIWSELFLVWKDISKYAGQWAFKLTWWIVRALFISATRIPYEAIKLWGWWIARSAELIKIASKLPKKPLPGGTKTKIWTGIIIAAWIFAYLKLSDNDLDEKQLEKKWLMKNWEFDIDKLWEIWSSISNHEKEEILTIAAVNMFPKSVMDKKSDFNIILKDWIFKIEVKEPTFSKNLIIFNDIERELSEFLYSLNSDIIVQIQKSA